VYYLLNWFHEERNAGDPSFLRIMKPSPPGCFYPYAQVSGNRLESGRSEGDVVWYLSRHVRLVAMVQEYTQIFDSYWRVRVKRRTTQRLLADMNRLVNAQGGKFTVILFDFDRRIARVLPFRIPNASLRRLRASRVHDQKLRQPDQHPTKALNELVAGWIEPIRVDPKQFPTTSGPAGSPRPPTKVSRQKPFGNLPTAPSDWCSPRSSSSCDSALYEANAWRWWASLVAQSSFAARRRKFWDPEPILTALGIRCTRLLVPSSWDSLLSGFRPFGWCCAGWGKISAFRPAPESDSYWIPRLPPGPEPASMSKQF
jgi:hypothetical protein